MAEKRDRNEYLEASSEEDDNDLNTGSGYDSEAAELSKSRIGKGNTSNKRRRTTSDHEESESDVEDEANRGLLVSNEPAISTEKVLIPRSDDAREEGVEESKNFSSKTTSALSSLNTIRKSKKPPKTTRPGIVYLPSLPPHLKPSALKHFLQQRGFAPVERLFLTPSTTSPASGNKSRARKSYTEGWLEFSSHKVAKRCVEALNATPVGGPKRGYYHDDLWNMRYLRGMTWADLMGQIREERREGEVRKEEERRLVKREVGQFLDGVEKAKRERTKIEKEKKRKPKDGPDTRGGGPEDKAKNVNGHGRSDFQWKQFQVRNHGSKADEDEPGAGTTQDGDDSTRRVLSKIF